VGYRGSCIENQGVEFGGHWVEQVVVGVGEIWVISLTKVISV